MDLSTVSSFLLIDEQEQIVVDDVDQFITHLGCQLSTRLKVVAIFGNTGDGKSYTLNHTFFNGEEVFRTSPEQRSCTIGVWAAYSPQYKAMIIDTEGLLGISENENRRTRLLMKILAISDIVLYRSRAERLHNDMFGFLAEASSAYWKYFSPELQAASERNSLGTPLSTLGPCVVIFHETQYTQILGTHLSTSKREGMYYLQDEQIQTNSVNITTEQPRGPDRESVLLSAEEHIQKRFSDLRLSPKAFSCIEYVGTQTVSPPTDFTGLQKHVSELLCNNSVRAPRTPDIIISGLQILNETFSSDIESNRPSLFPDAYFSCQKTCEACGSRCEQSVNHSKHGISHSSTTKCKYLHSLDNQIYLCKRCYDQGIEQIVENQVWSENESGWLGFAKYAWSGSVIECPHCGVIYRSRERWYGNSPPEHGAVKTENTHVWSKNKKKLDDTTSTHTSRKVVDVMGTVAGAVSNVTSTPSQQVAEWFANQIAPQYWVPNSEILVCSVCEKEFGKEIFKKHHCRACGKGVCDNCSSHTLPVPWRGWGESPVRVCDLCYQEKSESRKSTRKSQIISYNEDEDGCTNKSVTGRYISESVTSALSGVSGALIYPSKLITDSVRPSYWMSDDLITNCCVCQLEFDILNAKHHCRSCGQGVCDECSLQRRPVPDRGWQYPVRVCDNCLRKS